MIFLRFVLLYGTVLAVIFVNGWTDAANSITTVVSSGALRFRAAAVWAALCELAGLILLSLLCPTVAETVYSTADLGTDPAAALTALWAALLSVVLWAALAWRLGLPTSESHGLIAALTGVSAALHGDLSGVNAAAWMRVVTGLVLSTLLGALLGYFAARAAAGCRLTPVRSRQGEIACAGGLAFLHGAQDGQKFLAVLLLLRALQQGETAHRFTASPGDSLLCAAVLALGVICGGRRIVATVSRGVEELNAAQRLAADVTGIFCLLTASLLGLPVSTTHTRVSILFGAGSAADLSPRARGAALYVLAAWLLTFPVCGLLAWALGCLML